MSDTRPLWLATLGWGPDPWWDVTGRTARRRARRRLLDLALIVAVLAAFASTSGTGARFAGAAAESEPPSRAAAAVEASVADHEAIPIGAGQAVPSAADPELARSPGADPAGAPNLAPWAAVLVAMVLAFGAIARRRSGRLR